MRERRVLALSVAIVTLRVLALSLVLGVLSPYLLSLPTFLPLSAREHALLAGIAFGGYALSSALLQYPFALLADRWSRKKALVLGLALTSLGAILSAFVVDLALLALLRILSGAGAVNSIAVTLASESGPPETRTWRMAIVGAGAGGAFVLGIVTGALLSGVVGGVRGLFLIEGVLAALALVAVLGTPIPEAREPPPRISPGSSPTSWALFRMGFVLNTSLSLFLFSYPFSSKHLGWDPTFSERVLGVLALVGGLAMFFLARWADRGWGEALLGWLLVLLGVGGFLAVDAPNVNLLVVGGILFFVAHSSLSALLPSLVAKIEGGSRSSPQGALSFFQGLGTFAGGILAGGADPRSDLLVLGALLAGMALVPALHWIVRGEGSRL